MSHNTRLDLSRPIAAPQPAASAPGPARRSLEPTAGVAAGRRGSTLFLAVVLTAQLMVVLDATIVNVALPHIQAGLHFSTSSLSWVLNAYILTFGGFLLLGARAGDLLGRRRTFLAGIALFSAGSLAGGLAATSWMLLAARAAQGIGGALVAPSSLALLTAVFAEGRERLRAIALYTTVSAAGGAIGLVAGGLLVEWATWRWVMFVNVPVGAAVLLLGPRVLSETPRRTGHFDLPGAFSSTLGMAGIVLGLVEAGSGGWGDPRTFGPLAVGAALLALFLRNEARAAEPILPLRLLKSATRSAANAARGLVYAGMYGMFFFLGQFLQDVRGDSPIRAGLSFLPIPLSIFLSSQLASRVLTLRFRPKTLMLAGLGTSAVSLVLASRLQASTPLVVVIGELVLLGFGMGVSFVSLTSASLAGVPPADAGAASGLVNVSQQLGAAVGLAALVTVFGDATGHAQLTARAASAAATHTRALLVHGLDEAILAAAIFAVVAVVAVAFGVRGTAGPAARAATSEERADEAIAYELTPGLDAA
ncbi:MAG TPA: MFS transporter [Acidimicrobiales bacterium]|nr:MFS transporter [Acidimicrobiales bacterium]